MKMEIEDISNIVTNIEAEQSVIGSILLDPECITSVLAVVNADDFSSVEHREIFRAMETLYKDQKVIDMITMAEQLRSNGTLKRVGGQTYLTDCLMSIATSTHAAEHAAIVKERSVRSKLVNLAMKTAADCQDPQVKMEDILSNISKMTQTQQKEESIRDIILEYEEFEQLFKLGATRGLIGLSTGIKSMDNLTFGLMPGHVWVCGAYYGNGKSYFGINIANQVINQGKNVVIFSLEMSRIENIQRLIGVRAGLSPLQVIGIAPNDKQEAKTEARSDVLMALQSRQLTIFDQPITADEIYWKLKQISMDRKIDLVLIDYIQLIQGSSSKEHENLRYAANKLQQAGKEMKYTTLMLSQINNDAQKEGLDSKVDGFKGAGEIGANANVAIRIFRNRKDGASDYTDDFRLGFTKVRHNHGGDLDLKIRFPGGEIYDPAEGYDINDVI